MNKKNIITKEYLLDNYVNKNRTTNEISKDFGVHKTTISNYLIKYGIKRRPSHCLKGKKFYNTRKGAIRICKKCGKSFYIYPSSIKKGYGLYCNINCYKKEKVKLFCLTCKKEFFVYPFKAKLKRTKFCSQRCRSIYITKNMNKKETSIEKKVEQELKKRKILYQKQVPILTTAIVDFLLPNKTIIQCDGDYWHSRKINKGRDIAQDTVLHFNGYKVVRFWEHEINKSVENCISQIRI